MTVKHKILLLSGFLVTLSFVNVVSARVVLGADETGSAPVQNPMTISFPDFGGIINSIFSKIPGFSSNNNTINNGTADLTAPVTPTPPPAPPAPEVQRVIAPAPVEEPVAPQKVLAVETSQLQPAYGFSNTISVSGSNLIKNSSFETELSGKPRLWNYQLSSDTGNTKRTNESIRSGLYGLKMQGGGNGLFGVSQPVTKTTSGRVYTLSAYVKPVNTSTVHFRLGFWDEYNNRYGTMKDFAFTGTKEWSRVSMTVTTPGLITDSKNWFPILEVNGLTTGNFYVDDVQLAEGNLLTIYNTAWAGIDASSSQLGGGSIVAALNGDLYPSQSGEGNLGTSTQKWHDLFLSGDANMEGNLAVNGDNIASDNNLTINATGYVRIGETGTPGTAINNNDLYVQGNAEADGNLDIGGASTFTGNVTMTGDLAVNGGDLTSTATTFNLLNSTVTTLNVGGAATTVALGAGTGTTTLANNTTINMVDNNTNGLDVQEAANNYININTTNSSENISFGNATLNPSYNFLGTGIAAVAGSLTVGGGFGSAGTTVSTDGAVSANGLITGTTGLTITGAIASLNASSNFGTNINTGTSTGTVTVGGTAGNTISIGTDNTVADTIAIGSALDSLALNSAKWSIAATGAMSSIPSTDVVSLTIAPTTAQAVAINATDTDIATALSVGANDIVGTTGLINYDNFDVLATGAIQVAANVGLDTNGAGALSLGTTNATSITTGNAVASFSLAGTGLTAINLGTANSAPATILIGTSTPGNSISIGTNDTTADSIGIGSAKDAVTVRGATITLGNAADTNVSIIDNNWSIDTSGIITTTGLANLDGGIAVDTSNFTVSGTTGAIHTASTLDVDSTTTLGDTLTFDGGSRLIQSASAATNAGNDFVIAGGASTAGGANGGNLALNAGSPNGAGTAGTVKIGASNTSAVAITPATTITGLLTANGGITADAGVFGVADTTGAITSAPGADVVSLTINPSVAQTTAIDATAANIATALSVGANDIVGTTGLINYTNFDVLATGAIQVAAGVGLDTNAAGTLALGASNSNLVAITPATTITGLLTFNGGAYADGGVFTVTDATGAIHTGSTLDVDSTTTLGGDVTFDTGATRTLKVAQSTTGAGNDLTVAAGNALAAGDVNGGNLILQPGAKNGGGTRGAVLPSGNATDNFGATGTRWSSIFANTVDFITSLVGSTGGATPTVDFSTVSAANFNLQANAITDADVVDALTISGGTVNNSIIGGSSAAAATFTDLTASNVANLNGGIAVDTTHFTVDGTSGVVSELSSATTGNLLALGLGAPGVTQTGLLTGLNIDLSANYTTAAFATTGINIALKANAGGTDTGILMSGATDIGLDMNGMTIGTADIRMKNANTISNGAAGTVTINATTLETAANATIQPAADGAISLKSNTTGAVTVDSAASGDVNLGNGNNAKAINIGTGTAGNTIHIGDNNSTKDTITLGSLLDDVAIVSDSWDVTNAGVATFATTKSGISVNTVSSQLSLTAGFTLTPTATYVRVSGDSAARTSDGTTAIADGTTDGQMLVLVGTSDANTVTISDNANTQLAAGANKVLGAGDTLVLIWDSGASSWQQISYSDN